MATQEEQPVEDGEWESDEIVAYEPPPASEARAVAGEFGRFFGALWGEPRTRVLLLAGLFALVGVCAVSVYLIGLLTGGDRGTARPTATVVAAASSTAPQGTPRPLVVANGTPAPASAATPNRISLRGQPFAVSALEYDARGVPKYDLNARATAYWFPGTLVNYVLGLHASSDNKAVFDQLAAGDILTLDTGAGTLRYRVSKTSTIKADDTSLLRSQSTPQLTLLLMGEGGDSRRIVSAAYVDEGQPNVLNPMRFPINLGDVRVTVTGDRLVPGNTLGLAPGRSYYLVNVEITNLLTRTLDSAQFYAELLDGGKQRYAVSRKVSAASGGAGWPTGALNAGQTINATAGFDVPDSMEGPRLEWRFAASPSSPLVALISIPYASAPPTPVPAAPAASPVEVAVVSANIIPDTNELRIVGTISNRGATVLGASLRDVSLASGATSSALTSALPALPWTIPPGETLAFQVSFARPPGGVPAIFKILDQSFEIGGL